MGASSAAPPLIAAMSLLIGILVVAVTAFAAYANGAAVAWPRRGHLDVAPNIIGGQEADVGEFLHQVSLQEGSPLKHFCGGTVLSEEWVLTAAHCALGVGSVSILAGVNNKAIHEEGQQLIKVKESIVHEKFDGTGPFDIALLRLETPLQFSATVRPAKLPQKDAIPSGQATITGWGKTDSGDVPDRLKKVTLPIIPFSECNAFIKKWAEANDSPNPLADTNMCVGSLTQQGKGACNGDSGGPLTQQDKDGDAVVLGVASWTTVIDPCQSKPGPTVFTRVSAYVDWIRERTDIE